MPIFDALSPARRAVLAGAAASVLAGPALALTDREARALIDGLVGEINTVINSGKSEAGMIRDFENIFNRYGDVPAIARTVLGQPFNAISSAEQAAYTTAFRGYISRKYGKRFREFIGGRIEVNDARAAGRFFEVRTTAFLRGEQPFDLTFVVMDSGGQDRFINMLIEGVNLLATERNEVRARLDRVGGSVPALTQALQSAG